MPKTLGTLWVGGAVRKDMETLEIYAQHTTTIKVCIGQLGEMGGCPDPGQVGNQPDPYTGISNLQIRVAFHTGKGISCAEAEIFAEKIPQAKRKRRKDNSGVVEQSCQGQQPIADL